MSSKNPNISVITKFVLALVLTIMGLGRASAQTTISGVSSPIGVCGNGAGTLFYVVSQSANPGPGSITAFNLQDIQQGSPVRIENLENLNTSCVFENFSGSNPHIWVVGSYSNATGALLELTATLPLTVLNKVALPMVPENIVYDGHGSIWTALEANSVGQLYKVSVSTGAITAFPTAQTPTIVALDRSGNIWVGEFFFEGPQDVEVFNQSGTRVNLFSYGDTGTLLFAIAYAAPASGGASIMAISEVNSGQVFTVNSATGNILAQITLPQGPGGGTSLATGGGFVWAAQVGLNEVAQIATTQGTVVCNWPVGSDGTLSSYDGYIFSANQASNTVTQIPLNPIPACP